MRSLRSKNVRGWISILWPLIIFLGKKKTILNFENVRHPSDKLSKIALPNILKIAWNQCICLGMWYPDTWISGYLDIQAFLAIHYPDPKKVEISKYPSIQVSMISKYPCIQVSGYIKKWDIQLSIYPNIG